MRWRPIVWFLVIVFLILGVLHFWRSERSGKEGKSATETAQDVSAIQQRVESASTAPFALLGAQSSRTSITNTTRDPRLKYRLSNTSRTMRELQQSDQAILLANALIDVSRPLDLAIPDSLKAKDDPGSYIVQSRGAADDSFRAKLTGAGANIISYIPNNAYLVRASGDIARQLAAIPGIQAVIPFEPYYKLDLNLLSLAVENQPLPPDSTLNVVVYPNGQAEARKAIEEFGGSVVGEDRSPFGPVLKVRAPVMGLTALAGLPAVQTIGLASFRTPANDLSRVRVGVATNTVVTNSYLNLSGSNVVVAVDDSGVDGAHPDLTPRIFSDIVGALSDANGHGTHVAGIIASSGGQSATVSNAPGSIMPPTNGQFRGIAPATRIYSLPALSSMSDFELQERAARTNALISNNSWNYSTSDYDIAAASFDAAVRDSLPESTGPQPVMFVFAAGNFGNGTAEGEGVSGGTIHSPATAKNVITVGALEQPRNITNETQIVRNGTTNTSTPWIGMTDSETQVASFSSRGNVGVDVEGEFGRFKPDVVAPGTFVLSTRSTTWDQAAYYNPTNYHFNTFISTVKTNSVKAFPIFLPYNTVELLVAADAIFPIVDLPIYIKQNGFPTTTDTPAGTNQVIIPGPNPVEAFWFYGIGNPTNRTVRFQVTTRYATTNDEGNKLDVLRGINDQVGPSYRFETGTSMSAADVSGLLALIQDYFTNKLQLRPSPALMKALLINGARVADAGKYDLEVKKTVNDQGWGLPNITNSLPIGLASQNTAGASGPMLFFDQSPTNALATGERRTIRIRVDGAATNQPLRITLVWTDPPGNPAAGIKLVNDLDLVVTNLNPSLPSPNVYFGNDIPAGSAFTFPWDTNSLPNRDNINNVENVFIANPVSANVYAVSVLGRRVNVNAVTGQTNNVAQDFALVISSGDGSLSNAISIVSGGGFFASSTPDRTVVTNDFGASNTNVSGQLLLNQHVGANTELAGLNTIPVGTNTVWKDAGSNGVITLGITNQWHFYIMTNTTTFTNAAFATFLPPNLSLPRMGVTNYNNTDESARPEADIDMYVTTDPGLLTLDANAVSNADKSVGREGNELIAYSNAVPGAVYYIGIHSEDQQAAEFAFFGAFSRFPFSDQDADGFLIHGINVPANIPDGSPQHPGGAIVIGIGLQPVSIRRVIVTNVITHDNIGDLFGVLTHNRISDVLNNHSCVEDPVSGSCFTNFTYVYEDNGEGDIAGSRTSDGPGSLIDFVGEQGQGVWLLTEVDNAFDGSTGRVDSVSIRLQPQNTNGDTILNIQPNSFAFMSVDVPVEATNMTILVDNESTTTPLPLLLYVRHDDLPSQTEYDYTRVINPTGTNVLSINRTNTPPLRPGRYFIGVFNPNSVSQTVRIRIILDLDLAGLKPLEFRTAAPVPILDDAISYASIFITNNQKIAQAWIDLQVDHERISDMSFALLTPAGQRLLLFENRGGLTTAGLGGGTTTTNAFTAGSGGPSANTNILPSGTNGILIVDYDFEMIPDSMHVYYAGVRIFDTGLINGTGTFSVPYGPGAPTNIVLIMNEGNNSDTNTVWSYQARIVSRDVAYVTFTDDTNFSQIPIKFAVPPFTGTNSGTLATNLPFQGLFYFPEEPLKPLIGDLALGTWKLEMWDSRAGATNVAPLLVNWQLRFIFEDVTPPIIPLVHGVPVTNTLPECSTNYFAVDVPVWAKFATNTLIYSTAPVNVWFNTNQVPTGNPAAGDYEFVIGQTNGVLLVATNGSPPVVLYPGQRYYMAVENPCGSGNSNVTFAIEVDFDITPLTNAIPVVSTNGANVIPRYFYFDVSSNATAISFQLTNLTGNVDLVARRGAPLPTLGSFDYASLNPGTFDEDIFVFTNSLPVGLLPGRWYLGVFNRDVVPSSYSIVAIEYTNVFPRIITLTNAIPYFNTNNPAGGGSDYYRYVVSPTGVRAQFEINNPSDDLTLVVRKGLPLPSLALYDYLSANIYTNDEVILLFTNSAPIPLTPGSWFLTAVNVSGVPVNYSIKATEWPITGQPINITNIVFTPPSGTNLGSFCITWESLPGAHYFVQGRTNLGAPSWDTISSTITATGYSTTYCVPLPSPYHFFRVAEGIVPSTYSPLRVGVSYGPGGTLLQWTGYFTNQYQVQWSAALPPTWNTFTNIVTSTNGIFTFLDDGTQTGGLGSFRLYRVQQLP